MSLTCAANVARLRRSCVVGTVNSVENETGGDGNRHSNWGGNGNKSKNNWEWEFHDDSGSTVA